MDFFQTAMGKKFFEGSFPKLIRAIERLADSVDKIDARLAKQEAPKNDEKLSIDLGKGVVLTVTKEGCKDDYPGFGVDIEVDGVCFPFVLAELSPRKDSDEFEFSATVWGELGREDPSHIIKSRNTFADVAGGALGMID